MRTRKIGKKDGPSSSLRHWKTRLAIATAGIAAFSCSPSAPTPLELTDASSPSDSSNSGSLGGILGSDPLSAFEERNAVKVIFNKTSFYNNDSPNALGCAGDARYYYDPSSDRRVPLAPSWIKNISVDITNSNAPNGPSRAISCALSGASSAPPANCASFDDLQVLDGTQARAVVAGGFGCASPGGAGCARNAIAPETWNLSVPDASTASAWGLQSGGLPITNPTPAPPITTTGGVVWGSGGYDTLHDQFYIFGGATPRGSSLTGISDFTNAVTRIAFNSDGTVSTSPSPQTTALSKRAFYGGWALAGAFENNLLSKAALDSSGSALWPPPPRAGAGFTFGARRDPSNKSYCSQQDNLASFAISPAATGACASSKFAYGTNYNQVAVNEEDDYFLLTGGMLAGGQFSPEIYLFKPHGISNDRGAGGTPIEADGDWNLVSNIPDFPVNVSNRIMSVVDISYAKTSSAVASGSRYLPTFQGQTRPSGVAGDVFLGWGGLAYHRSVYDQSMNRFYIFGGLRNKGALQGSPLAASATAPDVVPSEVWIYDPPTLGRRPTAACFTTQTPDAKNLPLTAAGFANGAGLNVGVNRAYWASNYAFPPGGCLQRIQLDTAPPSRFEQAMAFDSSQKAMFVFGGCNASSTILDSGNIGAGNPLANCKAGSLLNDMWMYVPPTVTEIVPQSTYATTYDSPYVRTGGVLSALGLGNIFGTDFWLDHMPLFSADNTPGSGVLTEPSQDQVLGTWIPLPTGFGAVKPTPRASASFYYDRAHKKFYLSGGFGCKDSGCAASPDALNDLWEYTPPNIETDCDRVAGTCNVAGAGGQAGYWTQIFANNDSKIGTQPPPRYGTVSDFAQPLFSYGDDYYTVLDSACIEQGPIDSQNASVNKQFVGAIYIDIDRSKFDSNEDLLVNLRLLPFDKNTKLPAFFDNNTPGIPADDTDLGSQSDTAIIRVQFMRNPLKDATQIQASIQPRFHEYISGTPILGDSVLYVSGASGQVTEKQVYVPLQLDPSINMIKIERIQGSVKFYEMTLSKF